jgi:pumilio family protein 6
MAGIKRKSTVPSANETKSKSKKAKVEKSTSKRDSKHEVKPVKKSKPAKEESSEELEESDTSEPENGFYGFSAAQDDDAQMSDVDSSEDVSEAPKQNGKAKKSNDEENQKPKGDASGSKLEGLNGTICSFALSLRKLIDI